MPLTLPNPPDTPLFFTVTRKKHKCRLNNVNKDCAIPPIGQKQRRPMDGAPSFIRPRVANTGGGLIRNKKGKSPIIDLCGFPPIEQKAARWMGHPVSSVAGRERRWTTRKKPGLPCPVEFCARLPLMVRQFDGRAFGMHRPWFRYRP
jgi:hypothetical protein